MPRWDGAKWSSTESLGFYSLFECKLARSSQKDDVVLILYEPKRTKQAVECGWRDWTVWMKTIKLEEPLKLPAARRAEARNRREQQAVLV